MKWLKRCAIVLVLFGLGWAARGIMANIDAPAWLTIGVSVVLFAAALFVVISVEPSTPKRPPFETELDAYLRAHDSMLITRELANAKGLLINVVPSGLVPPKTAYFVNGEEIDRMMRDWSASLFQPVDDKHLPGCRRRHDATAPCICGERGCTVPSSARYIRLCTHSIGCPAHLDRPCPPEPDAEDSRPSINPRTGRVWCRCARENCQGCPE